MNPSANAESFESIEHLWIPMADGVRLSARLWLPLSWRQTGSPIPAILEYIPYRKRDMVRARDERNHPFFAANGYACLRVDMRGSGDSEGQFSDMYSELELDDAVQIIEWISEQPWCDGAIGMMGTSWGGTASLQAAASGSPLLKAIIAVCATNNRYEDDIHHMGGCLLTDSIEWGATLPAIIALPGAPGVDPAAWRRRWQERLKKLEFPLRNWILHETNDAYWRWGSVCERPDAIRCPTLAIGGWADRYSNTVMNLLEDLGENCWGIVGPWGHHYPDAGHPEQAIDFQQQALRWWDRWLKGEQNGICSEPRLRVWCSEFQLPEPEPRIRRGRWVGEQAWPSGNIEATEQVLGVDRDSVRVDASSLAPVPSDLTVGSCAGDTGYFGRPDGFPLEQSPDDRKSLVFDSEPLDAELEILGKAELELDLKTTRQIANLVIRLCDVDPAGKVCRVAYVIRNLALDENFRKRDESIVDKTIRERIVFPNAAYRFQPGHRIRISISSSYWPMIWPAPECAGLSVRVDTPRLVLPRRLDTANDRIQLPAVQATPGNGAAAARPVIEREVDVDSDARSVCYRWHQPMSTVRHDAVNLKIGSETHARHDLSWMDPQSARSSYRHRLVVGFDGEAEIEVVCEASLSACSQKFYTLGSIVVFEDGEETFRKNWSSEIARECS